jgi:hypothetical protein
MAIKKAINEVEVSRTAAASTDCEFIREMSLRARRKSSDLLMPHVKPFDTLMLPDRLRHAVERIPGDPIHSLHASGDQGLH